MQKEIISTDKAPGAIGPYSQAVKTNGLVYTSGQIPVDPATGKVVEGGIEEQANMVLKNLTAVLGEAGCGLGDVIKKTVFLKDMGDFAAINAVYAEYFTENFPARSCVQVAKLPLDVGIEIEAVAADPEAKTCGCGCE